MGGLRCPKCGRHVVRRTHRSGVVERLLSRGSVYPFRCQPCGGAPGRGRRDPDLHGGLHARDRRAPGGRGGPPAAPPPPRRPRARGGRGGGALGAGADGRARVPLAARRPARAPAPLRRRPPRRVPRGRRRRGPRDPLALAPGRAPLGRLLVRRGRRRLPRGGARDPLPRGEVLPPREPLLTHGIMTATLAPRRPPMSRRPLPLVALLLLP